MPQPWRGGEVTFDFPSKETSMSGWTSASLAALDQAVRTFDKSAAQSLCADLTAHVLASDDLFPEPDAKKALGALRSARYFDLMEQVADTLILSGQKAAAVQRQFAQSLIDQSRLNAALAVLRGMLGDDGIPDAEKAEARGLIGRIYKQMYVNAPVVTSHRKSALNKAVSAYYDVFKAEPTVYRWHGINAVALKLRAQRDKVSVDADFDPKGVAQKILGVVQSLPDVVGWDGATAAEACVALGRLDDALGFANAYLEAPFTDAFAVGSLLRQLREVWQIDNRHPMRALPLALEVALLNRRGGEVVGLDGLRSARAALSDTRGAVEKVFGDLGPVTVEWYRRGLEVARGVARIGNQWTTIGTGFLVKAGDFFPEHRSIPGDERLLVTNAHVLGTTQPRALRPADAQITFDELAPAPCCNVSGIVWESPLGELDATFARLSSPPECEPFPLSPREEPVFDPANPRRFFVIGHPAGRELSISLQDNVQVGWKLPMLHYRTPTLPGSSGSPVFDDNWRLVGIHHAGDNQMPRLDGQPGYYQANEGIWIHEILKRTRAVT
jgi:hypothetical protein